LIRAAISGAVIRGASNNKARIVFSYGSTTDPFDGRSYLGGASEANAARTVFLATPSRRAISLIATPSDRCKRRISAQFSTVITPTASGRGSRFPAPQGVSFQEASAEVWSLDEFEDLIADLTTNPVDKSREAARVSLLSAPAALSALDRWVGTGGAGALISRDIS